MLAIKLDPHLFSSGVCIQDSFQNQILFIPFCFSGANQGYASCRKTGFKYHDRCSISFERIQKRGMLSAHPYGIIGSRVFM